ncbi:hypothetical protein KAR91_54660 [Candidatus Pacearchaeota archaeon]|nr:hypothetical protein [Candidatus Pacearchaeota archaeon]
MSQPTTWGVPLVTPATPTEYATRDDDSLDALLNGHIGAARPAYAVQGTVWLKDTGASPVSIEQYFFDGVADILSATLDVATGNVTYHGDVDFLQSGAGAVTRTSESKMREIVSVKDFGAIGNGVADDTAAINLALTYIRSLIDTGIDKLGVYLDGGGGTYRIDGPLDATEIRGGFNWGVRNMNILAHCTDKVAFDQAGSQYFHHKDFYIWGDVTDTPYTLFQASRGATGTSGDGSFSGVHLNGYAKNALFHGYAIVRSSFKNTCKMWNRQSPNSNTATAWLTSTSYSIGDMVTESGFEYFCTEDHTSGVFATDHTARKWALGRGARAIILDGEGTQTAISEFTTLPTGQFTMANIDLGDSSIRKMPNTTSSDMVGITATYPTPTSPAWVTTTVYAVGDLVLESATRYICIEAHTAGTFSVDLAAEKWREANQYEWETGTVYVVDDVIIKDGKLWYRCIVGHTAGVFATDLGAAKWVLIKADNDVAYFESFFGIDMKSGYMSSQFGTPIVLGMRSGTQSRGLVIDMTAEADDKTPFPAIIKFASDAATTRTVLDVNLSMPTVAGLDTIFSHDIATGIVQRNVNVDIPAWQGATTPANIFDDSSIYFVRGAVIRIPDDIEIDAPASFGQFVGSVLPYSNNAPAMNQLIATVEDVKSPNVDGGTFTSGAWQTRDTQEGSDPHELITVSGNSITMTNKGSYRFIGSCPAYKVDNHKIRLNSNLNAAVAVGSTETSAAADGAATRSFIDKVIDVVDGEVITIQHRCETTGTTTGFGNAVNLGSTSETYTMFTIIKVG